MSCCGSVIGSPDVLFSFKKQVQGPDVNRVTHLKGGACISPGITTDNQSTEISSPGGNSSFSGLAWVFHRS